jgi:hypothetical protein
MVWRYIVWESKLNKRVISPASAKNSLEFYINNILSVSGRMRYEKSICNLLLSRQWALNYGGEEDGQ